MKIIKLTFLILAIVSSPSFAGETSPGNSYANKNGTGCNNVDPNIPVEEQSPGMKFIAENSFKNTGQAIRAARIEKLILVKEDLCFLSLNLLEEIDPVVIPSGPDCVANANDHACNGGGVQPGDAGEGKTYLSSNWGGVNESTDKLTLLNSVPEGTKVGYGDLLYELHDMTPAGIYAQQVNNTSAALEQLMSCQESNNSECSLSESSASAYLRNTNPDSAKDAIDQADQLADHYARRLGIGALQKHYTLAPGKSSTIHDEVTAGAGAAAALAVFCAVPGNQQLQECLER